MAVSHPFRNERGMKGGIHDENVCIGCGRPVRCEVGGALESKDCIEVRGNGGAQMEWQSHGTAAAMGLAKISASLRRQVIGVDGGWIVEGVLLDAGESEGQSAGGGGARQQTV